jgi:hypothetical protein
MSTVSPIAREAPSTRPATTPDSAAGKTTRTTTCHFAAPRPNAPSRSDCGTEDSASSETDAIVGTTRMPRMIAADRPLKIRSSKPRSPSSGVKNVSAKNPKTIVGIPARISTTGLKILRTRGVAYSAR